MIREWLMKYKPSNNFELVQAMREIMQEIALAGLSRGGFFENGAFYGGTALRIFHGLPRFSEDLDFSLIVKDEQFAIEKYFPSIEKEFKALGFTVNLSKKPKTAFTRIESAFLKTQTLMSEIILQGILPELEIDVQSKIKIKLEVDSNPPGGFKTVDRLLMNPFSFYVTCYDLPDLFAGKMHAILFRKWKNRVKGRDWYDFEWYVKNGIPLSLDHLCVRANQSGDWLQEKMSRQDFEELLNKKFQETNINDVKQDIIPFIKERELVSQWENQYFLDLIGAVKFC